MDSAPITEQQLPPQEQKPQTLQEKHQNEEEFKAAQASRRSRKDIEGRDFVCGCGKKYLSYPALYTHIKTKHDGRQPEGTMKYSTTAPAKKSKTKLEEEHLNYLISQVKRQDLKLMDLLAPKFLGSTPLSARLKSKILQKPLTDTYHSLLKSTASPLKISKQTSLEQHLVAWLIGVGEYVTQKLHDQYQWFARTVKECYYQMGVEVYNKCFSKKEGGLCYVPNFKVEKVKYFPLICDFYIRFFLVYEYTQLNANLMELILTDFCHWLKRRNCTFIEVILNKDYKLATPLKIQEDTKNDKEKPQDDDQKCDLSDLIDPESQKQDYSRGENKGESNQENEGEENFVEDQLLLNGQTKHHDHENIIEEQYEHKDRELEVYQSQDNQVENEIRNPVHAQNSHQNWSLQENPASESSQQVPPEEVGRDHHEQRAQSQAPQQQHKQENGNEEAQSEKL